MKLVLDFLLISGLLFTAIILIVLFRKKKKEQSHKVLVIIFMFILLVFLCYYAYLHKIRYLFYVTYVFTNIVDVFIGPLFLIYVRSITGNGKYQFKNVFPHFIVPLMCLFGIAIPSLIMIVSKDVEFDYLDNLSPILLFTIVYSFGYCMYALFKLIDFQKRIKQQYSYLENKDLNWIKYFLIGVIGIICINISTSIYETIVGDQGWDIDFITIIPIVFLVGYLGYYGVSQSSILLPEFLVTSNKQEPSTSVDKSKNSVIRYQYDASEMEQLASRLKYMMEKEKPFLEEDLTLTNLAQSLEVSAKKLSTLLNQNMNISFYDYINGHRIEEVKQRLSLPESEKYTLLAIAYDCGFNSKSSFNRIFKKMNNQSPSEYRKSNIVLNE